MWCALSVTLLGGALQAFTCVQMPKQLRIAVIHPDLGIGALPSPLLIPQSSPRMLQAVPNASSWTRYSSCRLQGTTCTSTPPTTSRPTASPRRSQAVRLPHPPPLSVAASRPRRRRPRALAARLRRLAAAQRAGPPACGMRLPALPLARARAARQPQSGPGAAGPGLCAHCAAAASQPCEGAQHFTLWLRLLLTLDRGSARPGAVLLPLPRHAARHALLPPALALPRAAGRLRAVDNRPGTFPASVALWPLATHTRSRRRTRCW